MKRKYWLCFFAFTLIPTLTRSQNSPGDGIGGESAVRYVGRFAGHTSGDRASEDIGRQINEAYASLPTSGGTIIVVGDESGRCYDFATPIVAAVPGKYLLLEGGGLRPPMVQAASTACLNYMPTTASSAITFDYVAPNQSANATIHGIRDLVLTNNHCENVGGCGSGATGIAFGGTNGGAQRAIFEDLRVLGFGTGLNLSGSSSSAGNVWFHNCSLSFSTTGFAVAQSDSGHISFDACNFQGNGTAVSSSTSISISNSTFDSNSVLALNCSSPAACDLTDDHFENADTDTTHYLSGTGVFSVLGGDMRDDKTTGTTDCWMHFAGMSFVILGTILTSDGRTASSVIVNDTPGLAIVQNNSPAVLSQIYSNASLGSGTSSSGTSTDPVVVSTGGTTYFPQNGQTTAVTGPTTFSGDLTATAGQNALGNVSTFNSILYVGAGITRWAGSDIGAQINSAYAALPSHGGTIMLLPQTSGACYKYSTPITFTTLGKFVILQGATPNSYNLNTSGFVGVCLNYTPTSATAAVSLDYGAASGSGNVPGSGLRELSLWNNSCVSPGGCRSSAVGVLIGGTNGGMGQDGLFQNVQVFGFGNGYKIQDAVAGGNPSWGIRWVNSPVRFNTIGINYTVGHENDNYIAGVINSNGIGANLGHFGSELSLIGGSVDDNTTCGINLADGAVLHTTDTHWENPSLGRPAYVCGATTGSTADIKGGIAYDDDTNTGHTTTQTWFSAGLLTISNVTFDSFGRHSTGTIILGNTRSKADVIVQPGTYFTGRFGSAASNFSIITANGGSQSLPVTTVPIITFPEQSPPTGFQQSGFDNCYGDSTTHALKCSYNGGSYGTVPLSGVSFASSFGNTTIGSGSAITSSGVGGTMESVVASGSTSITASNVVGCVDQSTTAKGATASMKVVVSPVSPQPNTLWAGYVNAADTIAIRVCNLQAIAGTSVLYNWTVLP